MTLEQTLITLRVHLTNISGAGATQLVQSLLPALEQSSAVEITQVYMPDRGALAGYQTQGHALTYGRRLPNSLSRLLECTILAGQFDGDEPLLVLGDIPLRCKAPQTVLVHTPNLLKPTTRIWSMGALKYAISRWLFRLNAEYARAYIVQTPWMRDALASSCPGIVDRIHVIAQPVPAWLLAANLDKRTRRTSQSPKLNVIYPSAWYPHKNHKLLGDITADQAKDWPVDSFQLTIPQDKNPAPSVNWIKCTGFLAPGEMIQAYQCTDAMVFLSTDESYGFPLIEAMFVGLPIICPDLPYARVLCGEGAIYFDPHSVHSLHRAILTLEAQLAKGWWPDWGRQLENIPKDWSQVASEMTAVACKLFSSHHPEAALYSHKA